MYNTIKENQISNYLEELEQAEAEEEQRLYEEHLDKEQTE